MHLLLRPSSSLKPHDVYSRLNSSNFFMPQLKINPSPFHEGYLPVGHGHDLYFAEYGHADAPAAVVLHGGPGSGCNASMLDWFDLSRHRVVLFDQRGAGRSMPRGMLAHNTTPDLVEDIERLRAGLRIPQWLVVGGVMGQHAGHFICGPVPGRSVWFAIARHFSGKPAGDGLVFPIAAGVGTASMGTIDRWMGALTAKNGASIFDALVAPWNSGRAARRSEALGAV